ncbi:MAG: sterol desaturase family protein [Alphaproteobacteria bacterium]|nr:sterol desaturase family protein [Alphaproteobacteria bacterium]
MEAYIGLLRTPLGLVFLVLLFALEDYLLRRTERRGYDCKESAATLGVSVGQIVLRGSSLWLLQPVFAWAYANRLMTVETLNLFWVAVLFVMVEFFYYWFHRLSHTIRWMWATHAVHHSSENFNFSAAFRLGWTGTLSGNWLFFLPMMFFGFPPMTVVAAFGANLTFQLFLHTRLIGQLGFLEGWLNTPSAHRVHHGANEPYLDKNFGGVTLVFDRLFGTYQPELREVPIRYGLIVPLRSHNPFWIALHEWAGMARDGMALLFREDRAGAPRVPLIGIEGDAAVPPGAQSGASETNTKRAMTA